MSAITPDSYVKLVRFDVTKEHQLTFANLSAQITYFQNLSGLELQASTYQRKEGIVRFPEVIDKLEQYNYLIYKNDSDTTLNYYQDKYFFCYIVDMTYINDKMTEIRIEQDVFQTWQFDFTYKKCFVEREHVNDDTFGKNLVPESLEHGNYIPNNMTTFDGFNNLVYLVQVTKDYISPFNIKYGTEISGLIFSGGFVICLTFGDLMDLIQTYESEVNLRY